MQMRHRVPVHEGVHVLDTFDALLNCRDAIRETADCCCLVVSQVTESCDVPFGLHHQPTSIRGRTPHRVNVTGIHEVILVDDASLRQSLERASGR